MKEVACIKPYAEDWHRCFHSDCRFRHFRRAVHATIVKYGTAADLLVLDDVKIRIDRGEELSVNLSTCTRLSAAAVDAIRDCFPTT